MHSHHSHSGDYVSHASGTLEGMIQTAETRGFTHYCLTEHMPRLSSRFLYPEEVEKQYGTANLDDDFRRYAVHAHQLKQRHRERGGMQLLVGFEVEGIDDEHIQAAKAHRPHFDMCVGSVHYVHGIPIDFNAELWGEAKAASGSARALFKDYFDLQYRVLTETAPEVVGHFDLIRLFQDAETDPTTGKKPCEVDIETEWPEVWAAMERNVRHVAGYGGLFELSSAAIRKGWASPYPQEDVARLIVRCGGRFCLSDDAHTFEQVGLNYAKMWRYVVDVLRLDRIYHLESTDNGTVVVGDSVAELAESPFWKVSSCPE